MITISPIENLQRLEELFKNHGLFIGENASGVEAKFENESLGYCLFDLDDKGILIHILEPKDDIMMADGILRSALHVAAERSRMNAVYSMGAPEELFEKLGFILDKEKRTLNIDKLFGGCGCKK